MALVAFGALIGVLPHLHHVRALGIPIPLWVMVVPLAPLFLAIGWVYARRADALDAAFRDLVER